MYDKTPEQIISYHGSMLFDRVRTDSYRQAILSTVRPGDVVLDLGTGTGLLAFFACQAGAQRVYAVEAGPAIELGRRLCRQNGFDDRIIFFRNLSTRVDTGEQVDVIVTETIGNLGLEEGILGWLLDARARLLRPGGRIIPHDLSVIIAPVEAAQAYQEIDRWGQGLHGLDLTPVRALSAQTIQPVEFQPEALLAEPACLVTFEMAAFQEASLEGEAVFTIRRAGWLHGLAGWFASRLAALEPAISLTNAPPLQATNWRQAFLPLHRPLPVAAGDQVWARVQMLDNGAAWRWQVKGQNASQAPFEPDGQDLSTENVGLVPADARARRRPEHLPELNRRGQVDRFILEKMDGTIPLNELSDRAFHRFPDYFTSPAEALDRVQALSQEYSR